MAGVAKITRHGLTARGVLVGPRDGTALRSSSQTITGARVTLEPVQQRIYLSPPHVTDLEEAAVLRAVKSGWIAPLGPEVEAFEAELAQRNERKFVVALSSGTAALHLALLVLGVGPHDVVVTSTMTFAATANAIVYSGAEPVFVDADGTGNINPSLLRDALQTLRREGKPAKAIVTVDLLGKVADQESVEEVAAEFGIPVVSDAAESLGAVRNGRPAGAFGTIAIFSFNGNKIMTTSGGGALLTDNAEFAQRARHLATQAREPVPYYEHREIGFNYRLSNLLAALGRAQLERLDDMIERRRQLRLQYRELFSEVPGVQVFGEPSGADGGTTRDNFWLTSILIEPDAAGFTAEELRVALERDNIESRPLWKPMHLQPVFSRARAFVDGTSEDLFLKGLSLPSGSSLGAVERDRIFASLRKFIEG